MYWHFIVLVPYQSLEMAVLITGVDICHYYSGEGAIMPYWHMPIERALPVMV
jgi:hypothetical protein